MMNDPRDTFRLGRNPGDGYSATSDIPSAAPGGGIVTLPVLVLFLMVIMREYFPAVWDLLAGWL
jgi:hypothetical protein